MNITLSIAAAALAAVAAAFAFAPKSEISTEVRIDASPQRVWAVLADGAAYHEWNPFIRDMKGKIETGATLENTMQPEGGKAMVFRPTVLKAEPNMELRWLGRLFIPRLFDGEHYFKLEPVEGGTRLVHGERFRGILLWFMDARQFLPNFEAMNAALKARVEGL